MLLSRGRFKLVLMASSRRPSSCRYSSLSLSSWQLLRLLRVESDGLTDLECDLFWNSGLTPRSVPAVVGSARLERQLREAEDRAFHAKESRPKPASKPWRAATRPRAARSSAAAPPGPPLRRLAWALGFEGCFPGLPTAHEEACSTDVSGALDASVRGAAGGDCHSFPLTLAPQNIPSQLLAWGGIGLAASALPSTLELELMTEVAEDVGDAGYYR